jgi:Ca2+-binding EF-hand superfamily protein
MKYVILKKPGGDGMLQLKRIFKVHDKNGNGKLDIHEFEECLQDFGIFAKKVDIQALHKYYDVNNDGNIDFNEYLTAFK